MPDRNIFICYRRDDAEGYAGRIFDRLNARFPRRVFMDVMGIRPGADFTQVIQNTFDSCGAFVAIIGRHWLNITDESNRRRLDQPDDYVRHEIAAALNRGITVIPVLVRDAKMPKTESLPPEIASLTKRNALSVTDADFNHDMDLLITAIEDVLGERRPLPSPPKSNTGRNACLIVGIIGALAASIVGLVILLYLLNPNPTNGGDPTPEPEASNSPRASESSPALPSGLQRIPQDFDPVGRWDLSIQNEGDINLNVDIGGEYEADQRFFGRWGYHNNKLTLEGYGAITLEGWDGHNYVGAFTGPDKYTRRILMSRQLAEPAP